MGSFQIEGHVVFQEMEETAVQLGPLIEDWLFTAVSKVRLLVSAR